MNVKAKDILTRYAVATVGLVFVAFGVALSIISNLGTAPLSCPSYVLNLKWPVLSVGTFTVLVNMTYMLLQIALLRKDFKAKHLLQILASAVFGYLIDGCMWALAWLHPAGFAARVGLTLLAAAKLDGQGNYLCNSVYNNRGDALRRNAFGSLIAMTVAAVRIRPARSMTDFCRELKASWNDGIANLTSWQQ